MDGITWQTISDVPPSEGRLSVDLSAYAGQVVYVRFVFTTRDRVWNRPDVWTIDDISLSIRR